jgi:hypothetical protein
VDEGTKGINENKVRSPADANDFPLAFMSTPALRPTQPRRQWVPGVLSPGKYATGA